MSFSLAPFVQATRLTRLGSRDSMIYCRKLEWLIKGLGRSEAEDGDGVVKERLHSCSPGSGAVEHEVEQPSRTHFDWLYVSVGPAFASETKSPERPRARFGIYDDSGAENAPSLVCSPPSHSLFAPSYNGPRRVLVSPRISLVAFLTRRSRSRSAPDRHLRPLGCRQGDALQAALPSNLLFLPIAFRLRHL